MSEQAQALKKEHIDFVRERFAKASAAVLLDFRGVTVEDITRLRAKFRAAGVEYKVVKNNLVRKALIGTALENSDVFDAKLAGPTGVAWTYEDPSQAAKIVKEFRKENEKTEKLTVKGGVLGDRILTAAQVEGELATLPGKDELRAKLLAVLQAPAQNLVRLLQAPGQNFVYLLSAKERQG